MTIFVDLDQTLADFDAHYEALFGSRPCKIADNVDWNAVRGVKDFYLGMPPLRDMRQLWDYVAPHKPIILTGVPKLIEEAPGNKVAWVRKHLGPDVEVRCCLSKEKALHCKPGDILIDDWQKYMHLWLAAGGRWVTHTSAADTIAQLRLMGI